MESFEQPAGDRVLHAMAQAYPDPVDIGLLSMVLGCDPQRLQSSMAELVRRGLAHARRVSADGEERLNAPCITDKGMAVADGLAHDADEAAALLERLEAATLRQLLAQRIRGSRMSAQQARALCDSLDQVGDGALVDAASVWAHQAVSDWPTLVRGMAPQAHASAAG